MKHLTSLVGSDIPFPAASAGLLVLLPLFACLKGCLKIGARPLAGGSPEHSILASVTPPHWLQRGLLLGTDFPPPTPISA